MNTTEMKQLLNIKQPLCVSIIVPTGRLAIHREADAEDVNKAISKAENDLKANYSNSSEYKKVIASLNEIAGEMDYTHLADGLGIYVAPGYSRVVKFPFPVVKKIKVDNSFDSRDILYMMEHFMEYFILSISRKYLRLYKCSGENIEEIKNGVFPMLYKEEFEYARPSVGNSFSSNVLAGYEKDKSVLQEVRLVEFLRMADKELKKILPDDANILVCGDSKDISDFTETTHFKQHIHTMNGSYVIPEDLARNAWKKIQDDLAAGNKKTIHEIEEITGKGKALIGLDKIWDAVYQGKGLKLIIEKDFSKEAYISMNESSIMLKKPVMINQYIYVHDITDTLIKALISKGGEVNFVENNSLEKFGGAALIIRYK